LRTLCIVAEKLFFLFGKANFTNCTWNYKLFLSGVFYDGSYFLAYLFDTGNNKALTFHRLQRFKSHFLLLFFHLLP
jgi:hypothetical protein